MSKTVEKYLGVLWRDWNWNVVEQPPLHIIKSFFGCIGFFLNLSKEITVAFLVEFVKVIICQVVCVDDVINRNLARLPKRVKVVVAGFQELFNVKKFTVISLDVESVHDINNSAGFNHVSPVLDIVAGRIGHHHDWLGTEDGGLVQLFHVGFESGFEEILEVVIPGSGGWALDDNDLFLEGVLVFFVLLVRVGPGHVVALLVDRVHNKRVGGQIVNKFLEDWVGVALVHGITQGTFEVAISTNQETGRPFLAGVVIVVEVVEREGIAGSLLEFGLGVGLGSARLVLLTQTIATARSSALVGDSFSSWCSFHGQRKVSVQGLIDFCQSRWTSFL